jgi:hypothetical protein
VLLWADERVRFGSHPAQPAHGHPTAPSPPPLNRRRRYSLEMRVPPGCAAAAAQLVARVCPAAQRRADSWRPATPGLDGQAGHGAAGGGGEGDVHLGFLIPRKQADLAALFAELEAARWALWAGLGTQSCQAAAAPSQLPAPRAVLAAASGRVPASFLAV